jgi:transcriptional regulator with XRE-family HTH domain
MHVKDDKAMGWTRESVMATVLWLMNEHRRHAADRLTELRLARGWTVEELAHQAGVSTKTVSRLQNAHSEPRQSTVRRIAEALEVDPAELLGPPPAAQATQLDRIEAAIGRIEAKLT